MRDEKGFTLVEILVVLMILGVLMGMTIPRFFVFREQARNAAMKMNIHNIQLVVEEFHAEKGYYADDFYEDGYGSFFPGGVFDEELGRLPTNPWSNRQMEPDDFYPEDYEKETDLSNTTEEGPNNLIGYYPGEVFYGVWEPEGAQAPIGYGLVGIGHSGLSIREFDADENVIIFVLHS
jgi:general secretion pathway protein G